MRGRREHRCLWYMMQKKKKKFLPNKLSFKFGMFASRLHHEIEFSFDPKTCQKPSTEKSQEVRRSVDEPQSVLEPV